MPKILTTLFFVLLLIACEKTAAPSFDKSFPGYYKVIKITSATPVDLNNDGLKTTDIYAEIANPFKTLTGELVSFYDFRSLQNYMEVRPLPYQSNDAKLISFNFPHQIIDYLSNNTVYLAAYNNEFLFYTYKINDDKNIQVVSSNPDYTNPIGVINSLVVKESGVLAVQLNKKVFDFVDKAWKQIDIAAEYTKVP